MCAHACLPVQISLTGQDTSICKPHRPPMDTAVTLFKILTSSLHRCHLYAHNKSCDLKHWSLQNQFHFLDPRQDVRSSRLSVYLHWGRQGLTYGVYTPEQSPFSWVEVTREERIKCHRFFSLPVSYFTMSTEVEDPQIHTASSLNYFHLPPTWTWFVTPLCPILTTSHLICGSAYPQFSFPLCLMLQQDPRALHC